MTFIEKYSLSIVAITFVMMLMMQILLLNIDSSSMAFLVGMPLGFVINGLRQLSLLSSLGNALAWVIYLFIASLPVLFSLVRTKKHNHDISLWIISVLFTCFNLYVMYGLLNQWFFQLPVLQYIEHYHQVLHFSISLMIGLFVFIMWFYLVMQKAKSKQLLYKQFQILLFITAILYTIPISFLIVETMSSLDSNLLTTLQLLLVIASIMVIILPKVLMIVLITKLITLSRMLKFDELNQRFITKLNQLSYFTKAMVFVSLFTTLLLGVIQLVFISSIQHVQFEVVIPWLEIIIAFVLLIITRIMIKSIAVIQENEQFI